MTVRDTSIEAYHKIKDEGLLSERRWQVYSVLFPHGPCTGGEVFKFMKQEYGLLVPTNSNTTTRLGELRDLGVVRELGTRVCSVSGQRVILWDVTSGLPIKIESKQTKLQRALERIKQLEAEVTELKFRLSRSPRARSLMGSVLFPTDKQASLFAPPQNDSDPDS